MNTARILNKEGEAVFTGETVHTEKGVIRIQFFNFTVVELGDAICPVCSGLVKVSNQIKAVSKLLKRKDFRGVAICRSCSTVLLATTVLKNSVAIKGRRSNPDMVIEKKLERFDNTRSFKRAVIQELDTFTGKGKQLGLFVDPKTKDGKTHNH